MYVIELDIATDNPEAACGFAAMFAIEQGFANDIIAVKLLKAEGPAGGNPLVELQLKTKEAAVAILSAFHNGDLDDECDQHIRVRLEMTLDAAEWVKSALSVAWEAGPDSGTDRVNNYFQGITGQL